MAYLDVDMNEIRHALRLIFVPPKATLVFIGFFGGVSWLVAALIHSQSYLIALLFGIWMMFSLLMLRAFAIAMHYQTFGGREKIPVGTVYLILFLIMCLVVFGLFPALIS